MIPGQDYNHTFAPVARWDSIRFVLSLAAIHGWELQHIDIKTTFLNGVLKEDIYMRQPQILGTGYWRLKKALYGLKQAGREFYYDMDNTYQTVGFTRCETDWSVYHRRKAGNISLTTMSVDDITIASNSKDESDRVVADIATKYEITDNGDAHWLLGCKIIRWRSRVLLKLDQERYTTTILEAFGMSTCNPVSVPMVTCLTTEMCPKTETQ